MANHEREFEYTPRDFVRVKDLLYRHAGIVLNDSKDSLVYSRLVRRLRALQVSRFADYLDDLHPDSPEWQNFLNALTTNLTAFFRENHHFEVLAGLLKQHPVGQTFRIWCCAASTGEEPYSLAMTAVETLQRHDPPVSIIATDIDTQVLQTARAGVYAQDRVRDLSLTQLRQFFLKGTGKNEGKVQVKPYIKKLIQFQTLNLLAKDWSISGQFDAIFCRNVLIYFDKPTQKTVVERFAPHLKVDGHLFVGHSENLTPITRLFSPCGRTVYTLANSPVEKH